MTENLTTTATDGAELDAATEAGRQPFKAGYEQSEGTRVVRGKIYTGEDGTATVTFLGQINDATTDLWVQQGTARASLYAEVALDDATATEVRLAIVPTGRRVPETGLRLGTIKRGRRVSHVYLLGIDGSIDRAAYEAAREARRAERAAAQAARLEAAGVDLLDDGYDGFPDAE